MVGVPTLVHEYSKCYQNSQAFAVTGISSTYYGRIQNFRLRTLGVPVSNSDSGEASENSLTPRSSKLKLRKKFFSLHCDVCMWQLRHLHWELKCNYANFENILEIPLTLIKQMCSTRSIWRVQARIWCSLWLKSAARQQNWSELSYKRKYRRRKVNSDKKIGKKVQDVIRKRNKGWLNEESEAGGQ